MTNELYHHGILGQKWGVRRFQNKDGSLTAAGKKRQAKEYEKQLHKLGKEVVENRAKEAVAFHNFKKAHNRYKKLQLLQRVGLNVDGKLAKVMSSEKKFSDEYEKYFGKIEDRERKMLKIEDFIRNSSDYNFKTKLGKRSTKVGRYRYSTEINKYKVRPASRFRKYDNRRTLNSASSPARLESKYLRRNLEPYLDLEALNLITQRH